MFQYFLKCLVAGCENRFTQVARDCFDVEVRLYMVCPFLLTTLMNNSMKAGRRWWWARRQGCWLVISARQSLFALVPGSAKKLDRNGCNGHRAVHSDGQSRSNGAVAITYHSHGTRLSLARRSPAGHSSTALSPQLTDIDLSRKLAMTASRPARRRAAPRELRLADNFSTRRACSGHSSLPAGPASSTSKTTASRKLAMTASPPAHAQGAAPRRGSCRRAQPAPP